jgi:restriction system protein
MARRKDTIGDLLISAPWWISAVLGVVTYVALRWIVPAAVDDREITKALAGHLSWMAPFAALFFGFLAVISALFARKRRLLVDGQKSLATLRATSWKDFEHLVAEAYRRQGFTVDCSLSGGADGGIDLELRKDGRRSLVQCKQWKVLSVGVPIIREMFGILTAETAGEAIIVTSGRFTEEARRFAEGKPIQLIDGPRLLDLVKSVQRSKGGAADAEPKSTASASIPSCPECGSEMVLRTARRGKHTGDKFWGCADYPSCRGTRPLTS